MPTRWCPHVHSVPTHHCLHSPLPPLTTASTHHCLHSPLPALTALTAALSAAQCLEPDRRAKLQSAAAGEELDRLNRQAATLIATHGLHERADPDGVGRWLCVGASSPTIAAGELVMLLPPNMLLWEEEVTDMNTCLQLCTTASGARLFSSSLTELDLDNLICHSCDPNCEARRTA